MLTGRLFLQNNLNYLRPIIPLLFLLLISSYGLSQNAQDSLRRSGPDERASLLVVVVNVRRDRVDEIGNVEEVPAPNLLLREMREPHFDQVQPRGTRRHEVQMEPRMVLSHR